MLQRHRDKHGGEVYSEDLNSNPDNNEVTPRNFLLNVSNGFVFVSVKHHLKMTNTSLIVCQRSWLANLPV